MRDKTAAILSTVLIGGMFLFPAVMEAVFLPSLEQGYPDPVPVYEQGLLYAGEFCIRWRWVLALPILVVLFTVSGITSAFRVRAQNGAMSDPKNRR